MVHGLRQRSDRGRPLVSNVDGHRRVHARRRSARASNRSLTGVKVAPTLTPILRIRLIPGLRCFVARSRPSHCQVGRSYDNRCGRAHTLKARYATFGFSDKVNLDEGTVWPVAFALKGLTAAEEASIVALVKKAVS